MRQNIKIIPPIVVKEKVFIHDTIPVEKFIIKSIPETLKMERTFTWKKFIYKDSLLKVEFESDTFRNFSYSLFLPQTKIIFPERKEKIKEKYGILILQSNFSNLNFSLGYKFLTLGIQYDFKKKKFLPLLGFYFSF
ncbi:MAG: hypothetical protein NC926_08360 [Candidatus Omnitrophica bacterium]|nr:hypothetical protein [Candidatus Omnitrophota bacterium]